MANKTRYGLFVYEEWGNRPKVTEFETAEELKKAFEECNEDAVLIQAKIDRKVIAEKRTWSND